MKGKIEWFTGGKTNASYNSLDVHLQAGHGDKVAFIWEGDEIGDEKTITYSDFHKLTCKIANVLKSKNILTGDSLGKRSTRQTTCFLFLGRVQNGRSLLKVDATWAGP